MDDARLLDAAKTVIATVFGNRYGLSLFDQLAAIRMSSMSLKDAVEHHQAEAAIADGTIAEAEAEAKADQAEQEADQTAIVEEPLDDPWDQMAENLRVLVEAVVCRDWHTTKVRAAASMATTLLPKLRANRDAEVRDLKDALWDTVSPATVGDGISRAEKAGVDAVKKALLP